MGDSRRIRGTVARLALLAVGVFAAVLVPTAGAAPPATQPVVTFTLLSTPPSHLAVGEIAEVCVRVESSEPFVMAIALSDAYFPGRGVRFDGSSAKAHASSADLCLTLTARDSTAGLPAVTDWPVDEDWEAGVLPLAIRVGARFAGGQVFSAGYLFGLEVS